MGVIGIDLSDTIDYVSKYDKDEPKTVWKLGVLSSRIRKHIEDAAWKYEPMSNSAKAKAHFSVGIAEIEVITFGLKGFENFNGKDGKKIEFETEGKKIGDRIYHVIKGDIIDIIHPNIVTELALKIMEINNISEDERKN